jgi:elongator complex protein 3
MQAFLEEIVSELKKGNKNISQLKNELCKKHNIKKVPTNIEILIQVPAQDLSEVKSLLLTKPTRTISGVVPVAIMAKPFPCPHGTCIFCPGGINSFFGDVPQSYTGNEPATMRAIRNQYDAYLQVINRIQQYVLLGHSFEKCDVIVMGGTFPFFPKKYQDSFILDVYRAMNDFSALFFYDNEFNIELFKSFFELPGNKDDPQRKEKIHEKLVALKQRETTLQQEKIKNETSNVRCIGLTIETKPDYGKLKHANQMLELGCTRVEIGIQTIYDKVLTHVNRGHTLQDTKESLQIMKDVGFKINAHVMPGLPLTTKEQDRHMLKEIFTNADYRPDMLKIYPCMVSPGTKLHEDYKAGKFMPLSTDDAARMIAEFKETIPVYCRIQRIQRDVPTKHWIDGVQITNLRQYIHAKYKPSCHCIRCREPRDQEVDWNNVQLKVIEYEASKGKEFFVSYEDVTHNFILGFVRLRFPSQCLRKEITKATAFVRELHVYGSSTALGKEGNVQHKGLGRKLMKKAEEIAMQHNKDKMLVISGIGVKEYYKKLGYEKEGVYMSKILL